MLVEKDVAADVTEGEGVAWREEEEEVVKGAWRGCGRWPRAWRPTDPLFLPNPTTSCSPRVVSPLIMPVRPPPSILISSPWMGASTSSNSNSSGAVSGSLTANC